MKKEQKKYFDSLSAYMSAMTQAKNMLADGIITQKDYNKIDTIMTKKYGIDSCSIFRINA